MNAKSTFRTFSLLFLLGIGTVSEGQQMLGLTFSTYSGVSSAMMNPALLTGSKSYIDVNLVGFGTSTSNNMYYFPAGANPLTKIVTLDTLDINNGDYKFGRSYNYYNNQWNKYIYNDEKIMGPSVMIQAGKHSFALSTSLRSVNSGNKIPFEIPILMYEGPEDIDYHGKNFNEHNYSFASMTWTEVGLSYAVDFYERYDSRFTFGATVKGLFGHEGGYLAMKNVDFVIHDTKTVEFNNVDAEIGMALPVNYETNEFNMHPLTKGYGVGLDLGFVFTKKKSTYNLGNERKICAKPYSDYIYKIGFSIMDLGAITFNQNAEKHSYKDVGLYWEHYDTLRYDGIRHTLNAYSQAFFGDPTASLTSDRIRIALPTVLSMQFDYHISKSFYVAALWSHPLKFQLNQLYHPAQISIIPRYENRIVGVSVPLSLFNYLEPRIGLAVRIYSLTIGTDRLGSWMGVSNFSGMDVYVAFKINLQKGICLSYLRGADSYGW